MNNIKRRYFVYAACVAVLVALDLIVKQWVASSMRLGQSIVVIPKFFHITLVHNSGAAFGIGAGWSQWFFLLTSVIALGVLVYMFIKMGAQSKLSRWACILILSGAIGNLTDRIRLGYVIDFLDVFIKNHHWPAFNIADSCISVGACLLALEMLKNPEASSKKKVKNA